MRVWCKSRGPPGRTELEDSILVGCVEGRKGQGRQTQEALFIEGTIEKAILFRPFTFGFVWFMGVCGSGSGSGSGSGAGASSTVGMMTVVMVVSIVGLASADICCNSRGQARDCGARTTGGDRLESTFLGESALCGAPLAFSVWLQSARCARGSPWASGQLDAQVLTGVAATHYTHTHPWHGGDLSQRTAIDNSFQDPNFHIEGTQQ